jgi:hypothetical protein
MLNHACPQSHLAAHRGTGKASLTCLLTVAVTRRRLLAPQLRAQVVPPR